MNKADRVRSVLVTGFEPFAGSTLNPSQVVAQAIGAAGIANDRVALHTALLPVDTQRIASEVESLWDRFDPDVVLHLGESAKASRLTLERVALNLLDFETPDNAGQVLQDQPIDPAGSSARFVTLPLRALRDRLHHDGIDAELSLSAGAYLCNQTLYLSLAHAHKLGGRAVGFVHVPSLPEQVQTGERQAPAMPREQLIKQIHRLITHVIDLV